MTVADVLDRVSDDEFEAWMAYDTVCPIGGDREVRQAALIAMLLANIHRDRKARQEPYDLDDFRLDREPQTPLTRAQEEARYRERFYSAGLVQRRRPKA